MRFLRLVGLNVLFEFLDILLVVAKVGLPTVVAAAFLRLLGFPRSLVVPAATCAGLRRRLVAVGRDRFLLVDVHQGLQVLLDLSLVQGGGLRAHVRAHPHRP